MIRKTNQTNIALSISAMALLLMPLGCGDDPSFYRGERLTFESPVSAQVSTGKSDKTAELDLSTEESSDFLFTRFGIAGPVPWAYPIYDYYSEPIPMPVPVSANYALIDYMPPMYFNFYPFFWGEDDEDVSRSDDDEDF